MDTRNPNTLAKPKQFRRASDQERCVVVCPCTVRICEGRASAALLLSQLIYWRERIGSEWMYQSIENLSDQTGLTVSSIFRARKHLESLGLVQTKTQGLPRRVYFRLDLDRLKQLKNAQHSRGHQYDLFQPAMIRSKRTIDRSTRPDRPFEVTESTVRSDRMDRSTRPDKDRLVKIPQEIPKEILSLKASCSEPQKAAASEPPPSPPPKENRQAEPSQRPVMEFPIVGSKDKTSWELTVAKVQEYREAFPHIDLMAELRKARQWCLDNPSRRKTFSGMPRFLGCWLGKVQNGGGGGQSQKETTGEMISRLVQESKDREERSKYATAQAN